MAEKIQVRIYTYVASVSITSTYGGRPEPRFGLGVGLCLDQEITVTAERSQCYSVQ